jgi:hypothetical protein
MMLTKRSADDSGANDKAHGVQLDGDIYPSVFSNTALVGARPTLETDSEDLVMS